MAQRRFTTALLIVITGLVWLSLTLLIVITEARSPGTDVFLFKEAGVNLATRGSFQVKNLIHMPPDIEMPFAFYPPLYPFFFGVWSHIVGVGLKQSLIFECLLRILRTLMIAGCLWAPLSKALHDSKPLSKRILIFGTLLFFSLISSDSDRPDELAAVWGFTSWYMLLHFSRSRLSGALSGIFLGFTGATSPAAGIFFGIGCLLFHFFGKKKARHLLEIALAGAITFFLVNAPILLRDMSAYSRFSTQAFRSTLPYRLPFHGGVSFMDFLDEFGACLWQSISVGLPYFFFLFVLGGALFFSGNSRKRENLSSNMPWICGLIFVPLSLTVWALQPYYLWFSCLAFFLVYFREASVARTRFVHFSICLVAMTPLLFREAKGVWLALDRPPRESSRSMIERIKGRVRPGERLAVTHDQFFTFRNHWEVATLQFVCSYLDRFDYAYITRVSSSRRDTEDPISLPCPEKRGCFALVEDFTTKKVFTIFGMETPYYVRGNGGYLYKNIGCNQGERETAQKVKAK